MAMYTMALGSRFLLEQPSGSAAELQTRLASLLAAYWIWKGSIWGGSYADSYEEATPKRHVLYSNDRNLLNELTIAAGHLRGEQLRAFSGEPLTKRKKDAEGQEKWSGNGQALKESQCEPQIRVRPNVQVLN